MPPVQVNGLSRLSQPCPRLLQQLFQPLHQYLIPDPNNVFFVRANGDLMTGAGILDQDLLIVDRSKKTNWEVVIASLNGELTLKRLVQTRGSILNCSLRIQTT